MIDKSKIGVWINGSSGRMGLEIQETLLKQQNKFRIVGGSSRTFEGELFHQGKKVTPQLLGQSLCKDEVRLVLDFSNPEGNEVLLEAIAGQDVTNTAIVVGTTGIGADVLLRWKSLAEAQKLSILIAPNTSIGILLTAQAALRAAKVLSALNFDIEIVETHHRAKVDAPSGTANFLARSIVDEVDGLQLARNRQGAREAGEVGVHSVRGGSIFGEHEIRMIGDHEEFTISHRALSRTLFAMGAVTLGGWITQQKPGFYSLNDVKLENLKV